MAAEASPDRPQVSVLLQTYNHERFIERAIESVVQQDAPFGIELIVSDDHSEDGTRAVVSEYARAHEGLIKPLFPDRHLGMNPLFRRALNMARGDYLALLDGDDYWTSKDKLRRQVALLDSEPDLTGCFHDALVITEDDERPTHRYVRAPSKRSYGLEDLIRLCHPPTLSVVFRREMLPFVPEWVFDLAWADWLIWIFATRQGPFAYLDEVMGVYRVHGGGYFSSRDRASQLEEDVRVYQRLLDVLPEQRDLIGRCLTQRSCELAVEECGIPFDAPLILIGDFGDLPVLFNGRTTRCLDSGALESAAHGRGASVEEGIQRLCRMGASRVRPLWRSRRPPRASGAGRCYVIVPKPSGFGVARLSHLTPHLKRAGSTLWDDTRCAIYELPGATAVEVVELSSADARDGRVRGRIGQPSVGSVVDPSAVRIVGWALGKQEPVAGVEIESGGRIVWRGSVGANRPDLAEAFPDCGWAGRAGFVGEVDVQDALGEDEVLELDVTAVLASGERTRIGGVRLVRARAPARAGQ